MKIGRHINTFSCEYEMQRVMREWLFEKKLIYIDELRVKEVHRIPDFLIQKRTGGLINIEAKCNAFDKLLYQMNDNAKYCNYSFAFLHDYCLTPKWFKKELLELGYGLIIYNVERQVITEVLEAHMNIGVDYKLQKIVIEKMNKEITKRKSINSQKIIEFN